VQTDEWCVHNRLFNANPEVKLKKKKTPNTITRPQNNVFRLNIVAHPLLLNQN
jgi:hypothetical protein